jgi:phage baseplate assembly protein W
LKTFALQSGDLVIGKSGHKMISGTAKVRQDLALALGELYGNDRFHPTWGSVLPNYVGTPIGPDTEMLVKSEVARVIQSYIGIQQAEIVQDALKVNRTRFTTSDVVTAVTNITTQVTWDILRVQVTLATASNQTVSITRSISL